MKTQTALYKALLSYLEENDIDAEKIDQAIETLNKSVNSFSECVTGYVEEIKNAASDLLRKTEGCASISANMESSKNNFEKTLKILAKMTENIDPLIAAAIYERVATLKDTIDLFEGQIVSKLDKKQDLPPNHSYGLRNQDRAKVFLVSEFSAGKTSFVKRLLGDVAGKTGGGPVTASLVIHKQTSAPSFCITFNKELKIPKSKEEKFKRFLDKYDLAKHLKELKERGKVFDWGNDKILSFIAEANFFPEVFSEITWNHIKPARNKNYSFLDFADLYDMPGVGGEDTHDKVVGKIFKNHKPDIILYLINTDSGVPSDAERKLLPEIMQSVMQREPYPLFYWVYQKPSNYEKLDIESIGVNDPLYDEEFLKGRKGKLEEYIADIIKEKQLTPSQTDFLGKTSILDARGLSDDSEMAQNAVSIVLQDYLCRTAKGYCEIVRGLLHYSADNKAQLEVMNYKPDELNYQGENPFIQKRIVEAIKNTSNLSIENVKMIFLKALAIDDSSDARHNFPFDLEKTLSDMKKNIHKVIDEMLKSVKPFLRKEISIDSINKDFWNKYTKTGSWQELLFKVQAYHWLISHYRGFISPQYINSIGSKMLDNIKNDIKRLEDTKIPFSLTIKLGGTSEE